MTVTVTVAVTVTSLDRAASQRVFTELRRQSHSVLHLHIHEFVSEKKDPGIVTLC